MSSPQFLPLKAAYDQAVCNLADGTGTQAEVDTASVAIGIFLASMNGKAGYFLNDNGSMTVFTSVFQYGLSDTWASQTYEQLP